MLSSADLVALVAILLVLVFFIGRASNFRPRGPYEHLPNEIGIWFPPGSFPPPQHWPPRRDLNLDVLWVVLAVALLVGFTLTHRQDLYTVLVPDSEEQSIRNSALEISETNTRPAAQPSSTKTGSVARFNVSPPTHPVAPVPAALAEEPVQQTSPTPSQPLVDPAYFVVFEINTVTKRGQLQRLTGEQGPVHFWTDPATGTTLVGVRFFGNHTAAQAAVRAFKTAPEYRALRAICTPATIRCEDLSTALASERIVLH